MDALTESHLRAFNAVAVIVDRKLLEIESALYRRSETKAAIIRFEDDLSSKEKAVIHQKIEALRGLLLEFRDRYNLQGETKSPRREINVSAAFLWEDLAGAADKKLKGYGPLDLEIRRDFTDYMEKMAAIAMEIVNGSR